MYKQIPFYNLDILKIGNFTISLSALLLIVLLCILIFLKDRSKYFKYALYITYSIIIIGVCNILFFQESVLVAVEIDSYSKLAFYIYNIMHYPINSMITYFMIYSYLMVITFIPFYVVFNSKKLFIIIILSINILNCFFNIIAISNQQFSFYNIILASLGFIIGYLLVKITGKNQ